MAFFVRRTAVIAAWMTCLASPMATLAEPELPPAPAPEATAPEAIAPAEAPPAVSPTPQPDAVTPQEPKARVLLLPVEFTVYQLSAAGPEAMPDWTAAARKNLAEALEVALEDRTGMEIVPMPELAETEQAVLDSHVGVARLVVFEGSRKAGKAWATRRADFDRQLGPGLAWLRERSGADYAVLVAGSQYEQSGGLVFAQVLAAAAGVIVSAGGGTNISTALIDLAAGEVKWFNSTFGVEVLGVGSIDFRKVDSSAEALRKLMAPYPLIPSLEVKP
jgi:hypothetical protein